MKPIRIITLALVLALCAFSAPPARAQIAVCKIYGTVDSVAGPTSTLTTTRAQITVTRASKSGSLFLNTSRVFNADATGRIEFYAPRTVGTDTAVIHIRANFGDLAAGQTVYVPDADSAELRTLPRYTANPTFVVVAVPSGGGSGDTSLNGHPRLTRIENVEGQFTAGTSDSLQQIAANVFVARNVAEGKANADSVHTVLVALSNLIAGKGGADSIHTALVTLYDLVAGKPNADSVHTAIDAMLKKADTTALHAQRFAVINDSLFAISLRATSTANDLTAHVGTADAHLPSQTGASGKFLQSNGTVSSWQTALTAETDPTATAKAQTVTADSLAAFANALTWKILPSALRPTGALGQVLAMLPGGVVGWKADSAGGSGTVDTTLQLPATGAARTSRGPLSISTTTNPALHINGSLTGADPAHVYMRMTAIGNGQALINFFRSTTEKWSFGMDANDAWGVYNNGGNGWMMQLASGAGAAIKLQTAGGDVMIGSTATPRAKLDVAGNLRCTDSLRVGNYTTYSWIKPGDAAWTASSTIDVKRDIAPTDTASATDTRGILARVASVDPVRYRFRPQVFRVPFDTAFAEGKWFTMKVAERQAFRGQYRIADSLKAEEKAAGYLTGFLAEQFNAAFGDPNSKEISYSDVVAVEWRAIQALIRRTRLQEQRIDALEETIRQMDARLRAGGL